MAEPTKSNPKTALKPVARDAAARTGNGNLPATQREAAMLPGGDGGGGMTSDELQKWVRQVESTESAARMGKDTIETGLMSGHDLLDSIAADMGMKKIDLSTVQFSPELIGQVPMNVAKKYSALPVHYTEDELWVAISDPHNVQVIDDL